MLRLKPESITEFIGEHKAEIIGMILTYTPDVIKEEAGDMTGFTSRIFDGAIKNGAFDETFGHRTERAILEPSDIEAFAMHVLVSAGKVPLWSRVYEHRYLIDSDLKSNIVETEVPQITISWQYYGEGLQCVANYPDGTSEIGQTWMKHQY